ncbi:MAG: hypothetical protein WC310_05475 [Patescibacteria group bacterium]|jgi:hypothetical protein
MTLCTPLEALRSVRAWKKFDSPNGYGLAVYGFSYFGHNNPFSGIYQRRRRRGGVSITRMKFYRPPVSRTEGQAALRDKFQSAVNAWQALSDAEREELRHLACRRSKRGYNVFITQYLKTH